MGTYQIRPGDTLSALARRFGSTVSELARLNGIKNPNLIIAGRLLQLPDVFSTGRGRSLLRPDGTKPAVAPKPLHPAPRLQSAAQAVPSTPEQQVQAATARPKPPTGVAAQYAHYAALIKAAGGKFRTGPYQMNLLGLRKDTNTHANGGNGRYDDQLVMLWKDSKGRPHVKLVRYNTEPAYNMRAYSDDVNHDGRPDQGRIPTGYFEYGLSSWKHGFCLRAHHDFRVQRDMNHDGAFNDGVMTGGGATMLFHEGGRYGTGSAGCQTFAPDQWAQFMRAAKLSRGTIGYTLIKQ
jgi:LysM repeat protein